MKIFRHKVTGKFGKYPDHFIDYPDFELYDPQECVGCEVEEEEPEQDDPEELEVVLDIQEEGIQW